MDNWFDEEFIMPPVYTEEETRHLQQAHRADLERVVTKYNVGDEVDFITPRGLGFSGIVINVEKNWDPAKVVYTIRFYHTGLAQPRMSNIELKEDNIYGFATIPDVKVAK